MVGRQETGTVWTFTLKRRQSSGIWVKSPLLIFCTLSVYFGRIRQPIVYAKYSNMIVDCTAVDSYTFILSMSEPGNAALYFMTFPVLCQSYCQAGNIDTDVPLGTGPFLSAFNRGHDARAQRVVVEAAAVYPQAERSGAARS